ARRAVRAERARVDLVHARELPHVDEKHAAAQHVLESRAGGLENRGDVLEDLFRLRFDVGAGETSCRGIASRLTRYEHEIAEDHAGRVGPDGRRQVLRADGLHSIAHAVILVESLMRLRAIALLTFAALAAAAAAQDPLREAINLGHTKDQGLFDS